jgi:hypothetical protein
LTVDDAVAFEVAKLLDQHFLGHPGNGTLEFRKAECAAVEAFLVSDRAASITGTE